MKNIFSLAILLIIAFPENSAARGCYIKYCPNPPSDTSLDSFCPKYKQFVICWEREIVVCDEYDVTELSRFYFKVGKESYLEQCEPRKVETTTTTTTSTSTTTSKPKPKHCNKPQCGKNNRSDAKDCETRLRHLKCLEPYYNKCDLITDDEFALFYLQKEETEQDCQNDKDSELTTTRKTTTSTTTKPPTTTSTTTKPPTTTTTKTTTSTTTKPPTTTTTTTSTTTTIPTTTTTTSTTSTTTTTPITSTSQAKHITTTTVKSTTAKRTTTSTVPVTSQSKTITTSHKSSKCTIPECSVPKEPLTDVSQCEEYKEYRRCMSPYYEECDTLSENLKKIYFEEQLYTDEFCSQNEDKLCPVNFETKLFECQSKLDFGIFALFKLAGGLVDDYRDNVDIDFDFEKVSAECMDGTYTSALTCSENLMTRCAGNPAMSYIEQFIDISKQKASIERICSRREELDENMGCLQAQAEKSASFYESVLQRMNTEIRNHRRGGKNNIKWIIDIVCEYTKEAAFYTNHFFQSCGTNAEAMATSILHADIPRVCAVEFTGSAMRIELSLPLLLASLLIMMFRH